MLTLARPLVALKDHFSRPDTALVLRAGSDRSLDKNAEALTERAVGNESGATFETGRTTDVDDIAPTIASQQLEGVVVDDSGELACSCDRISRIQALGRGFLGRSRGQRSGRYWLGEGLTLFDLRRLGRGSECVCRRNGDWLRRRPALAAHALHTKLVQQDRITSHQTDLQPDEVSLVRRTDLDVA